MVGPPPHILLEREKINDNVVEALDYGALNFKLENTLAKAGDYTLQSILEVNQKLRNAGMTYSSEEAKLNYNCSELWSDWNDGLFPADQSNYDDTGGRRFETSVNFFQFLVITSLCFSDKGATSPKLVIS